MTDAWRGEGCTRRLPPVRPQPHSPIYQTVMTYPQRSAVETLEGRRLMSMSVPIVTVPGLYGLPVPGIGGEMTPAPRQTAKPAPFSLAPTPTAPASAPAGVQATSLIGHWEGDVRGKILIIGVKVSATLDITAQTPTTLTGSIDIKGNTYSGTFKGHITARTGKFNYTLKDGKNKITLTGRLNPTGQIMEGKITAKYHDSIPLVGRTVKGEYDLAKMV